MAGRQLAPVVLAQVAVGVQVSYPAIGFIPIEAALVRIADRRLVPIAIVGNERRIEAIP